MYHYLLKSRKYNGDEVIYELKYKDNYESKIIIVLIIVITLLPKNI